MKITCIQVVRDLDEASGGPSRSISQTALALARLDCECHLITQDRGQSVIDLSSLEGHVKIHWLSRRASSREFATVWRSCLQPSRTIVHVQGLWSGINHLACRAAQRDHVPYVVAPRGMLEPWAINHKKWRKKLAYWLYQRNDLVQANYLHATSLNEVNSIQRMKLNVPVEVIGNAVEIPSEIVDQPTSTKHARLALFLGRIHPVKGLENLIKAWCQLPQSEWQCWIVGPGDRAYIERLRQLAVECGGSSTITFRDAVTDSEKWQVLKSANLFVQPSHSENFGMAIAESLGCALPVITTKNTPWQELETHRCGWWIDDNTDDLYRALAQAISLSDEERQAMGRRGRELILTKYCWSNSAKKLYELYLDLLQEKSRTSVA